MTRGLIARLGLLSFALLSLPATAAAHFHLDAPDSWAEQNTSGSPQKSGPCGETDSPTVASQAKPTNKVTAYKPGDTVVVKLTETVTHPGYYRVALAKNDRSELPPDPDVTPGGGMDCGTAKTEATPTFPVLVDNALQHTTALSGQQTIMVKLPSDVSCTNCTLQIIEFMSNHNKNNPGGCFYHHCANISIQGDATGTGGASGQGGSTAAGGGSSAGASAGGAGAAGATTVGGGANGGTTSVAGASSSGGASVAGASNTAGGTLSAGGAVAVMSGGAVGAGGTTVTLGSGGANMGGAVVIDGDDKKEEGGCAFVGGRATRSSAFISAALLALAVGMRRRRIV